MFGGIATAGPDALLFAQLDGEMLLLELEGGRATGAITPHPFCPETVRIGACAVAGGLLLLADTRNHRVRAYDRRGRPRGLIGAPPPPGIRHPDEPGVVDEPVGLLALPDELIVVSSGQDQEWAVQRFGYDGAYRGALLNPLGGFFRAHGAARVGDEIWIAETEGSAIRRFAAGGAFLGDVKLHTELKRPFRLADDGYGGVFALLAPEGEEEQEVSGVARLERDGAFGGWVVGGDRVHLPFDIAVLPDGRFAVADLPYGEPPDVRVQLFGSDGRPLRTLFADRVELGALREARVAALRPDDFLARAQHAHYAAGGEGAEALYRAAIEVDPDDPVAWAGLAALLAFRNEPGAEEAFEAAIGRGAPAPEFRARIAACRHARGDLDGAIDLLTALMEGEHPPEEPEEWLDRLGAWYLERAGEA